MTEPLLAGPLAKALDLAFGIGPKRTTASLDDPYRDEVLRALRSDPAVLAAMAEALPKAYDEQTRLMWATDALDALLGQTPQHRSPRVSDYPDFLASHFANEDMDQCEGCRQDWPCDASILAVALATTEGRLAAGMRVNEALDHDYLAAKATIEAMAGDAADLIDCMDEAAVTRTALAHVLKRTHDSGCGICAAARALLRPSEPREETK